MPNPILLRKLFLAFSFTGGTIIMMEGLFQELCLGFYALEDLVFYTQESLIWTLGSMVNLGQELYHLGREKEKLLPNEFPHPCSCMSWDLNEAIAKEEYSEACELIVTQLIKLRSYEDCGAIAQTLHMYAQVINEKTNTPRARYIERISGEISAKF